MSERAAKRLRLSQPPLTRQLHALEDELGAPLFARTPRGVTLLPAGEALLAHAREILARVDAAAEAVRRATAARAPALVPTAPREIQAVETPARASRARRP